MISVEVSATCVIRYVDIRHTHIAVRRVRVPSASNEPDSWLFQRLSSVRLVAPASIPIPPVIGVLNMSLHEISNRAQ